jgi:tetratricopeptide (TPR) repeat protein
MKIRYGLVLAMAIGLGLVGCASGGGGGGTGSGGISNITGSGEVMGAGENPRDTDNTRAAEDALGQAEEATDPAQATALYQQALRSAEAAIAEDPTNPLAYRLAGTAAIGAEQYESAGEYLDRAVELRPLYEFDLVGVREQAWIDLYQEATPFLQSGDYAAAAEYFEGADAIYRGRPEAMVTLGQIYAQQRQHDLAIENIDNALAFLDSDAMQQVDEETAASWREQIGELPYLRAQVLADAGRFEEAVGTYRELSAASPNDLELKRGLAAILMEMGEQDEAFAIYEEMLGMQGLSAPEYYSIGVGFYQGSDYERAVRAFGQAAEASVNDRDAIEMWARSLQLDSAYAEVPPVAERWIELDPNSQNAYLILAQSQNQLGNQAATQEAVQAVEALEVAVNDLTLRREPGGGATVTGSVVNKTLSQGAQVTLDFTFYDPAGTPIGSETQTVSVGAADMAQVFTVEFDSTQEVAGYGYTLTSG